LVATAILLITGFIGATMRCTQQQVTGTLYITITSEPISNEKNRKLTLNNDLLTGLVLLEATTNIVDQPITCIPKEGPQLENHHLLIQLSLVTRGQPKISGQGGRTYLHEYLPPRCSPQPLVKHMLD